MVSIRAQSHAQPLKIGISDSYKLRYFDEGAANVVYQIGKFPTGLPLKDEDFAPEGEPSNADQRPRVDERLKGKLLRLRKDAPSAVSVKESHDFFKNRVEPLFQPGMLVEQELCEISSEFLVQLNKELRRNEKNQYLRNQKRRGTYLAEDEPHGTLITNMLFDDEHVSCDFKPKWLLQSPSAPQEAKRCRTCALRALRNDSPVFSSFCPLTLTSKDEDLLKQHLEGAFTKMRGASIFMPQQIKDAMPFMLSSSMLPRLKELQQKYDPDGPLGADMDSEDFRLAMTLRDCSMLMKVNSCPKTLLVVVF